MNPEIQRELASVVDELNELSATLSQAQGFLLADSEGSDSRGAVSVRLDAAGRVAAFRPNAQWRNRVAPDELGDAVLEAVQLATTARFGRWADAMEAGATAPPAPPPRVTMAAGPTVDLMGLVEEVLTGFEALADAQAVAPSTSGPGSDLVAGTARVRITMADGGVPTAVHLDPRWIANASLTRLAEEVLDAFQAAYDHYDGTSAGAATTATPAMSAAMAAVAADPAGMLLRYARSLGAHVPDDIAIQP